MSSASNNEWILGCVLCLCGASATVVGYALQKLSHVKAKERAESAKDGGEQTRPCCDLIWISGFMVFLLGQILNMLSLGLASEVLISVLGSFSVSMPETLEILSLPLTITIFI
jgi:hypothetical protein